MKKISNTKIFVIIMTLCTLYLNYHLYNTIDAEKKEAFLQLSSQLKSNLENEKKLLKEIGIINAISIAENKDIKTALINKDRQLAIQALEKISKQYEKRTNVSDLKVHIHTSETKSFVRNWKLLKFGDDLSTFRRAILNIKKTSEPTFGFEVGRMGLTLRSIVAIESDKKFLGSLEFIQNFENVRKNLEKQNIQYLLLMNSSLISIASYLKNAPKEGNYVVSLQNYDKKFLKESEGTNFKKLKRDGYILRGERLFTYINIRDIENNNVGMHLLSIDKTKMKSVINETEKELFQKMAIINFIYCFILLGLFLRKIFNS